MCFDDVIDLLHEPVRFRMGLYNLLILLFIFVGESAALAILEPFMADLIATLSILKSYIPTKVKNIKSITVQLYYGTFPINNAIIASRDAYPYISYSKNVYALHRHMLFSCVLL